MQFPRVGVPERGLDFAVTESFADGLQADAIVDEFGGMSVPELVQLDVVARSGVVLGPQLLR